MEHVFACLEKLLKIGGVLLCVNLGGPRHRSLFHFPIELRDRHGLTEIIHVLFPIQLIVEASIPDIPALKVFFG